MSRLKFLSTIHLTKKYIILIAGIFTLCYALMMPDRNDLFSNFLVLITSQTQLTTDFFEIAGLSAPFFNTSLHFFIAFILMQRNTRSRMNGLQVAATGIFIGHSFFGTHILNIIPILFGVSLYAKMMHHSFKRYTSISLFTTALSPIVSFIFTQNGISILSFLTAMFIGVFLGMITPRLAEEFLKFHQGLTLYNFGFTTGLISMLIALIFPYFKITVERNNTISTIYHYYLLTYFICILIGLIFLVIVDKNAHLKGQYIALLKSSGRVPDDFMTKFGTHATLLNMTLTGAFLLSVLLILQVNFNALVLGALISVVGFSAFGDHIRNITPILLGVFLAAYLLNAPINDARFVATLLFSTGLAPIAGYYGIFYGILAGFLHYNLTANVVLLHQGLTLYNNGFSTGFVAGILSPLIDVFDAIKYTIIQGVKHAFRK